MTISKVEDIIDFLKTNEAYKILDRHIENCTFSQGGCLILADMFDKICEGQIFAVHSLSKDNIQHFGFFIENVGIVDSDGVYDGVYGWIDAFCERERLVAGDMIASSFSKGSLGEIPRVDECSKELAYSILEKVSSS